MVVVYPFYYDPRWIKKKLEPLVPATDLMFIGESGCLWDMSAYYSVAAGEAPTVFVNDTLFKKPFALSTLRKVTEMAGMVAGFNSVPVIVGDLHPTYDLQGEFLGSGKHISTYCFCLNGPAKLIFREVFQKISRQTLSELKKDPVNELIYRFGFQPTSRSSWKGLKSVSGEEVEIKYRCTLIEFWLSLEVERRGVLIDVHPGGVGKIIKLVRRFR